MGNVNNTVITWNRSEWMSESSANYRSTSVSSVLRSLHVCDWSIRLCQEFFFQSWGASSPLCWFNNKEFFVYYTYSRTQLYFI